MIRFLVEIFTAIAVFLVLAIMAGGAGLAYILIPDVSIEFFIGNLNPVLLSIVKCVVGGLIGIVVDVVVFGPFFVLVDIRNGLISLMRQMIWYRPPEGGAIPKTGAVECPPTVSPPPSEATPTTKIAQT